MATVRRIVQPSDFRLVHKLLAYWRKLLVVRDSYLTRKSIVTLNVRLDGGTKRDTFGEGYRQISLIWGMRQFFVTHHT
jgi:hypothetical protein